MALQTFGITSPVLGVKQNWPSITLQDAYLPDAIDDIKNIIFRYGEIHRAKLRVKEFSQNLPDQVLHYEQYWQKDQDWWLMLCSKRDIAYRDASNDRMVYLTPKYETGTIRVENASTKVYGGLNVDDCDDDGVAWVDGSGGDVTPARETTEKKENTASVKLTVAAGAGVELLAYHDLAAPVNLSTYDSMGFWIYSSVALDAGDLKFYMDDTAGCGSPIETIDISAVSAATWTWVNVAMADPSLCTAIASIGIYQAVDKGAMTLYIDQIVAGDWAGQLAANNFITIGTTYTTDDTWYEISSVDSDTAITLTAVYAGSTAYQQAYQARVTYTGANTNFWESKTFNDKWIATNGVNNVQVWDGTNQCSDLSGSPPIARHIAVFENYVILGNLSGTDEPYSFQWCSIGDETNWSTGDSGLAEIDGYYNINGFAENQGFLIILTERTLEKIWLVGGDLVFNRSRITSDCGAWASGSIVESATSVYFYAADNTFRVYTGFSWNSVSDNIDKFIKNFHPDYEKNIRGVYSEEYNCILWTVADSTSSGNNTHVLVYDMSAPVTQDVWSKLDIAVCAFGFYEVETQMTWDNLPYTTWENWDWEIWNTRSGRENAPHDLVSDYSGYTYQIFGSQTDDGAAYTGSFVLSTDLSEDKQSIMYFKRVIQMKLILRNETAGTLNVSVKKDYESSWVSLGSVSLDGSEDILFLDLNCDILAKNFLFKFDATSRFRFIGIIFPDYDLLGLL